MEFVTSRNTQNRHCGRGRGLQGLGARTRRREQSLGGRGGGQCGFTAGGSETPLKAARRQSSASTRRTGGAEQQRLHLPRQCGQAEAGDTVRGGALCGKKLAGDPAAQRLGRPALRGAGGEGQEEALGFRPPTSGHCSVY